MLGCTAGCIKNKNCLAAVGCCTVSWTSFIPPISLMCHEDYAIVERICRCKKKMDWFLASPTHEKMAPRKLSRASREKRHGRQTERCKRRLPESMKNTRWPDAPAKSTLRQRCRRPSHQSGTNNMRHRRAPRKVSCRASSLRSVVHGLRRKSRYMCLPQQKY